MHRRALAIGAVVLISCGCYRPVRPAAGALNPSAVPDVYRPFFGLQPSPVDQEKVRAALPYDWISLERTGCLGSCPVYKVTFSRDGKARLESKGFMGTPGVYSGSITLWEYGRLCYLIDYLELDQLQRGYGAGVTDSPGAVVTVMRKGGPLAVGEVASRGPLRLWAVEEVIDGFRLRINWTHT